MSELKLISNFAELDHTTIPGLRVHLLPYPTSGSLLLRVMRTFFRSFGFDYIVLNGHHTDLLGLAILRTLVPFHRCRLISVDLMLSPPNSPAGRILHRIKVIALKRVDLVVLYYKNTRGYEEMFGINKDKIRFVPFKVNALELIMSEPNIDQGYVFTGGVSRRDYTTFLSAVTALGYPTKMITGRHDALSTHDSMFDDSLVPENVEIVPGCPIGEFVRIMAGARVVVIPLKEDSLAPAGISVYLQAMAARKCVVISNVAAVDSVLTEEYALLVPPGDPNALREAIRRAFGDPDLRERLAEAGQRYALGLGGEERLMRSLLELLLHHKGTVW
jgi:glycosyltransferase involved in cell wall biosynthesis